MSELASKPPVYDRSEEVVGVLGLSPYATIDFLRKLADVTPAEKDWEHLRVLVDIDTKIPSRGRAIELGEEDPTPGMRDAVLRLSRAGAGFVVIPCNTSHCFYEDVVGDLGVTVLNIIEETAAHIISDCPGIKTVGLMASRSTVRYELYHKAFATRNVAVLALPELQDTVSDIIERVKVGNDGAETRDMAKTCAEKLIAKGAEGIILGCTELPLVLQEGEVPVPVYDSNRTLALAVLHRIRQDGAS